MNINTPLYYDIKIAEGSTFVQENLMQYNNSAIDFTGYTAEMYIAFSDTDSTTTNKSSWVTFSVDYDRFIITIPASFTSAPTYYNYKYNIILTDTNGIKYNVLTGNLSIIRIIN